MRTATATMIRVPAMALMMPPWLNGAVDATPAMLWVKKLTSRRAAKPWENV